VAAFCATLEETIQADVLLHVIDASNPNRDEQIDEVNKILKEIGADTIPQLLIFNKIDLMESDESCMHDEYGRMSRIRLSAKTGKGVEFIRQALSEAIEKDSEITNKKSMRIDALGDRVLAHDFFERTEQG
jgi:GTP-binding protein HflX